MEKIMVVQDISWIWDGSKLRTKDFSNKDLSKLDLSVIPEEQWENCIFYNTNFKNTNIKFKPMKLEKSYLYKWATDNDRYAFFSIEGCNFENCDLSYLKPEDMRRTKIKGCNFNNTGLKVDFEEIQRIECILNPSLGNFDVDATDVKFDKNYNNYNSTHWDKMTFDMKTLELNPNIQISSGKLFQIIKCELPDLKLLLGPEEIEKYIRICEGYLKFDREGYLKQLYSIVKSKTNLIGCYRFFHQVIQNIDFTDIDFGVLPKNIFENINFMDCKFDNTTIRMDMASLASSKRNFYNTSSQYVSVNLPSVVYGSWRDKGESTRVGNTPITFRTNVYVELDRVCNAKCTFCRNNSFCKCKYDLNAIKNSLFQIYPYLDDIVIGGGEPTLRLKDLISLREYISMNSDRSFSDWYIFTNGTLDRRELEYLKNLRVNTPHGERWIGFNFNISRHAVKDGENAAIFGVSKNDIYSTSDLEWIAKNTNKTTLCATCFKGGLDSFNKIIEYIIFAQQLGFERVLLSSLHKDNSSGIKNITGNDINIDDLLFEQVMHYLQEYDFIRKLPIYSTGGYTSTVLAGKDNNFTVAFKQYITKAELENNWVSAIKRTFDLSIDPSGELFENWHQQSGVVDIKELLKK